MQGPFLITNVDEVITYDSPGSYILSRDGKIAHYVGRSDIDIRNRIKQSISGSYGYKYFWFEYATSPMKAYYLECEWYHKYAPTDNTIHPAVPSGANWRCPSVGCEWS